MTEPGTAVAIRTVPVPAPLAEIGVRILHDETSNSRIIAIPREVKERCNVIDPVTSLVQADPNWTPRISVVELDPDADNGKHFYKQANSELAPTKQALEVLAKGAGILYTKTDRIPKAELDDGEIGYRATVGIRRSDGTIEEIRREKVWVEAAERAEIEDAVTRARAWENGRKTNKPKYVPDTDEWRTEVQKRWLKELKDRYAKTESKAVLRAIRAALQIPHTFKPADAAKPFLVIGFSFTPDYEEPEMRRALVAAGLNPGGAAEEMYGPRAVETINLDTGEITPAEEPADVVETEAPEGASTSVVRSPDGAPSDGGDGPQDERGGGDTPTQGTAAAASSPGEAEYDWAGIDDAVAGEPEQQTLTGTGDRGPQIPGGKLEGQHLADVAKTPDGIRWIKTALKRTAQSDPFRVSMEAWVEEQLLDVWQEYLKSKEG